MTPTQALTEIAALWGLEDQTPEQVVAKVTDVRNRYSEEVTDHSKTSSDLERAKQALGRGADHMDAVSTALLQRRLRAKSDQAFADMTALAGDLVSNAAEARNVQAQV